MKLISFCGIYTAFFICTSFISITAPHLYKKISSLLFHAYGYAKTKAHQTAPHRTSTNRKQHVSFQATSSRGHSKIIRKCRRDGCNYPDCAEYIRCGIRAPFAPNRVLPIRRHVQNNQRKSMFSHQRHWYIHAFRHVGNIREYL